MASSLAHRRQSHPVPVQVAAETEPVVPSRNVNAWRFRSFKTRIIVLVLGLLALVQVVGFLVVDNATTRSVRGRMTDELRVGARVFERHMDTRTQQLTQVARLLSADFGFKSAFATGDAGTVLSALENQRVRIAADVMMLVSLDGRLIADTLHPRAASQAFAFRELIERADQTGEAAAIVRLDGRPYQMVVLPLMAPMPVAWIALAFVVDDALAAEMRRLTGVHVSFVLGQEGQWATAASTLPPALRDALPKSMPSTLPGPEKPRAVSLGSDSYLAGAVPLPAGERTQVAAVLQKSVAEAFQPFQRLRFELLAVFAGGLGLSAALGLMIARSVSHPVERLVHGVRGIERGDYQQRVEIGRTDELRELAVAINNMAVGIAQREESIRRSEERLRQAHKLEAVGRLAGGIAHDFNNLLTVIRGYADLLRMDDSLEESARRDLKLIEATADRASALVRQLLAFSRKQVLQPIQLDLNEIVTDMSEMLRRLIGKNIDLLIESAAQRPVVKADPSQLEQIVVNLIVNARDAMPDGGRIAVRTGNATRDAAAVPEGGRPGPHVVLTVSDTGSGMSPEVVSHVFEPFFTTKEPGKGTGLGLSTVYGIVRQHGGTIDVESAPGRGTTFTLWFPAHQREAAATVDAVEPAREDAPGGTETIVLVEDDDDVRTFMRTVLESRGYTVMAAADGAEALRLSDAYQGPVDLVVTDVVLPKMSGRAVAAELAARWPGVKTLFVSGYTDDARLARSIEQGTARLLEKPFGSDDLARKVREVLGEQQHEAGPGGPGGHDATSPPRSVRPDRRAGVRAPRRRRARP